MILCCLYQVLQFDQVQDQAAELSVSIMTVRSLILMKSRQLNSFNTLYRWPALFCLLDYLHSPVVVTLSVVSDKIVIDWHFHFIVNLHNIKKRSGKKEDWTEGHSSQSGRVSLRIYLPWLFLLHCVGTTLHQCDALQYIHCPLQHWLTLYQCECLWPKVNWASL